MIEITEKALTYFKQLLEENKARGIVVSFKKAGCSGYEYELGYWKPEEAEDNTEFAACFFSDVAIVTPKEDFKKLVGTTIDLKENGLERKIEFNNPNVTMTCGCGVSVGFA